MKVNIPYMNPMGYILLSMPTPESKVKAFEGLPQERCFFCSFHCCGLKPLIQTPEEKSKYFWHVGDVSVSCLNQETSTSHHSRVPVAHLQWLTSYQETAPGRLTLFRPLRISETWDTSPLVNTGCHGRNLGTWEQNLQKHNRTVPSCNTKRSIQTVAVLSFQLGIWIILGKHLALPLPLVECHHTLRRGVKFLETLPSRANFTLLHHTARVTEDPGIRRPIHAVMLKSPRQGTTETTTKCWLYATIINTFLSRTLSTGNHSRSMVNSNRMDIHRQQIHTRPQASIPEAFQHGSERDWADLAARSIDVHTVTNFDG